MSQAKQRRTFISYSSQNKEFALNLGKELRSSGFNIWLDQLDIPAGSRWDDEVERALEECEIFMVILTPASSASDNVKDEIGYAIDTNKHILPILLKNASVPLRLRRFQYVDFTAKSFEEGLESAKKLLRELGAAPTAPIDPIPVAKPVHKKVSEELVPQKIKEKPQVRAVTPQRPVEVQMPIQAQSPMPGPNPIGQKSETISAFLKKNSRLLMILGAVGAVFGVILVVVVIMSLGNSPASVAASPLETPTAEVVVEEVLPAEPTAVPTKQPTATQISTPTFEPATSTPELPTPTTNEGNNSLVESFDNNSNGWLTGSDMTGSKSIMNGNYVWDVHLDSGSDAWQLLNEDLSLIDFQLKVDAKRINGSPDNLCYGIIFRAEKSGLTGIVSEGSGKYYELEVCDDQYYLITYYDGSDWNYWQDWTESTAIHPNDWNTLEVKAAGNQFEYFVNDVKIAEFSDSTLAEGNVGLSVYSYDDAGGQIAFDNFSISNGPNALSASDAAQMYDSTEVKGFYELASEIYTDEQLTNFESTNESILLELTNPIPLMLGFSGWCSKTPEILEENLLNVQYLFELNGQEIPEANIAHTEDYTADDGWACAGTVYSIIDGWTSGEYIVRQTINILTPFSDGEYDYEPGVLYSLEYTVVVP